MHNAENDDLSAIDCIVNDIRIAYQWNASDTRPFGYFWSPFRERRNSFHDATYARFNLGSGRWVYLSEVGKDCVKLRESESRKSDFHTRRYFANTASTSSSLAISPRLTAARASSIAASSAGVAW